MVNKQWLRNFVNDINTPPLTLKQVVGTSLTPVPVAITGNILKNSGNIFKKLWTDSSQQSMSRLKNANIADLKYIIDSSIDKIIYCFT